jgi:hypothetical protein
LIQSFPLADLGVLDIETDPSTPHSQDLLVPGKGLWVGKISKTVPENSDPAETWWKKAGIMAEFGHIICITTGYFIMEKGAEPGFRSKCFSSFDKSAILGDFCATIGRFAAQRPNFQCSGHHVREFDMPRICRRTLANRMPLPALLGVPTPKTDMDGSMAAEAFYGEKDLPRIVSYCQQDVLAVAILRLRFRNPPLLKNERVEIAG